MREDLVLLRDVERMLGVWADLDAVEDLGPLRGTDVQRGDLLLVWSVRWASGLGDKRGEEIGWDEETNLSRIDRVKLDASREVALEVGRVDIDRSDGTRCTALTVQQKPMSQTHSTIDRSGYGGTPTA